MLKTSKIENSKSPIPMSYRYSSDYYPFGSTLPTRSWNDASGQYRYGFNGKEKDSEKAYDNYDFGARIYDGRLGRFLKLDALIKNFPWNTPYAFAENDVISCMDLDGLERYFTVGGLYLGQIGTSNQILIVKSKDIYEKYKDNAEELLKNSSAMSAQSNDVKKKIIKTIYHREFPGNISVMIDLFYDVNKLFASKTSALSYGNTKPTQYTIFVNTNADGGKMLDDYMDLTSMLFHEQDHILRERKSQNSIVFDIHEKVTSKIFTSSFWNQMTQLGRNYHLKIYKLNYIDVLKDKMNVLAKKYDSVEELEKSKSYQKLLKKYNEYVSKYENAGGKLNENEKWNAKGNY